HWRRLAPDARPVFGVGGPRDRADARRVLCRGLADQRPHAALFRQSPSNVMQREDNKRSHSRAWMPALSAALEASADINEDIAKSSAGDRVTRQSLGPPR